MANKSISELPFVGNTGYTVNDIIPIVNYDPSGTTKQTLLTDLKDYIISGVTPYKVYTALLTQTGTSDPDVVILENTIGNIVWTRQNIGQYIGTLTGAFTSGKTVSPQFPALAFELNGTFIPISANGNPQLGWINAYCQSEDVLNIDTYDMSGGEEWSIILGSSFFIEIRVYP